MIKIPLLLSRETIEGWCSFMYSYTFLKVSLCVHAVKSFVELSKHLLSTQKLKGKYILNERFSQDPLENHFGNCNRGVDVDGAKTQHAHTLRVYRPREAW